MDGELQLETSGDNQGSPRQDFRKAQTRVMLYCFVMFIVGVVLYQYLPYPYAETNCSTTPQTSYSHSTFELTSSHTATIINAKEIIQCKAMKYFAGEYKDEKEFMKWFGIVGSVPLMYLAYMFIDVCRYKSPKQWKNFVVLSLAFPYSMIVFFIYVMKIKWLI